MTTKLNITIRHAEPDDYLALARVSGAPLAQAGTLQLPFPSSDVWKKRLAEVPGNRRTLVALVETEIVGTIGLIPNPNPRRAHAADMGMAVRDDFAGQGVGTALMAAAVDLADNWLNLLRLELTVWADNAAAVGLYTKFGFVREGLLRGYGLRNGVFVDALEMARFHPKPPNIALTNSGITA